MASPSLNSLDPSLPTSPSQILYSNNRTQASARHARARECNPNFDRTTAKVDKPDHTKLTIIIQHPDPIKPTQIHYPHDVDWSDQKSISTLNRWRGRNVRYWLGAVPRANGNKLNGDPQNVFFCKEEKAWLLREGKNRSFKWNSGIWKRFNDEFEGAILKSCLVRRPGRSQRRVKNMYMRLGWKEASAGADDDLSEASKSELEEGEIREDELEEDELEEGEIREYPPTKRLASPWNL